MKGRLFSQAFCVACCVIGHHWNYANWEKAEQLKKEKYEMERLHICSQRGISIEEFEEMRYEEHQARLNHQNSPTQQKIARRLDGGYFTPEQKAEIEATLAELHATKNIKDK